MENYWFTKLREVNTTWSYGVVLKDWDLWVAINNEPVWFYPVDLKITAVTVGSLLTHTSEHRSLICVVNAEGAIHLFHLRSAVRVPHGYHVRDSRFAFRFSEAVCAVMVGQSIAAVETIPNYNCMVQPHRRAMKNSSWCKRRSVSNLSAIRRCSLFKVGLFAGWWSCRTLISLDFNENEKQVVIGYCDRMIRIFTSILAEDFDGRLSGRIALKYVFNVAEQIHTISARRMSTRDYELIVSQPGGNLLRFNPNEENGEEDRWMRRGQDWIPYTFEFRSDTRHWDVQPWLDRMDRSDICG